MPLDDFTAIANSINVVYGAKLCQTAVCYFKQSCKNIKDIGRYFKITLTDQDTKLVTLALNHQQMFLDGPTQNGEETCYIPIFG